MRGVPATKTGSSNRTSMCIRSPASTYVLALPLFEETDSTEGRTPSTAMLLVSPSDPAEAGSGSERSASLSGTPAPAASLIVPPFRDRAFVRL